MAGTKATLESLAALISNSSKSADEKFAALAEDIADIESTMATKADARAIVHEELAPIRSELKSIRDDLAEKVENVIGYRKEIDHALERIAAVGLPGILVLPGIAARFPRCRDDVFAPRHLAGCGVDCHHGITGAAVGTGGAEHDPCLC